MWRDGGVVDADIQRAEPACRLCHDGRSTRLGADVRLDAAHPVSVRRAGFMQPLGVAVGGDDAGAGGHEQVHDLAADAARGPGDDRHRVLEIIAECGHGIVSVVVAVASRLAALMRIEGVAQAVAQDVQHEDQDHDRKAGKDRHHRRRRQVFLPGGDHRAP